MNAIKFLLGIQIKRSKLVQEGGFTLIELLVAMIIAVLVITPLLGFMVNILNTDRQEQAKASSEQEIQTALDYISRDLQQAVYIYDANGISTLVSSTPSSSTTSQLPVVTGGVPVLVFWKREFIGQVLTAADTNKDDTFVYSLVAYYLIKDTNSTWSNAARIARWQIRDGVPVGSGGVDCAGYSGKYVSSSYCPSSGFSSFNLEGVGTLEQKMNTWTKLGSYTTTTTNPDGTKTTQTTTVTPGSPIVLMDYIDQTTTGAPSATCSSGSKVPQDVANLSTVATLNITSFYACVDRVNTTAQVFLRGNALARLRNTNLSYADSRKNYFPTASVRVQGRGFLFTK
ncbi:MAG: hormogonium polysaccharide secretion pseudopilin HpsC [Aulosira sp. ZfuVER01]|nr:hormogonium polysaccharide secretion pseudopilin HpsC [Aulosira sp. ZfuVER01]MDZ7999224.1 hormogonium polysaccharide secretion pseudopilin HpsC [Aulosira sp. DedVER01a]MDZ8051995.1 hormogonium polysaccharide secretion pseudopilin HpsC [Aulosira sp. ZfuCHP01]